MKGTKIIYGIVLALTCSLVATLKAQNIYVGNTLADTIGKYGLDGSTVNASLITGLNRWPQSPTPMAISGNDLFVVNYAGSATGVVSEYTISGTTVNASVITGLIYPYAIAVSGNDLFVASYYGTVGEYTTSGETVNASLITGLGQTEGPISIAISGNDLFVAHSGIVGEYTTSGATINASLISGLGDRAGIAISPVPEPAAGVLAGLGVAALWLLRRRA